MRDIQTPVHAFTVGYCIGVAQTASSPARLAASAVRMAEQPDLCARATDKGGIMPIKRSSRGQQLWVLGACRWEGLLIPLSVRDYCQSHLGKQSLCERTIAYIKPAIAVISCILHF